MPKIKINTLKLSLDRYKNIHVLIDDQPLSSLSNFDPRCFSSIQLAQSFTEAKKDGYYLIGIALSSEHQFLWAHLAFKSDSVIWSQIQVLPAKEVQLKELNWHFSRDQYDAEINKLHQQFATQADYFAPLGEILRQMDEGRALAEAIREAWSSGLERVCFERNVRQALLLRAPQQEKSGFGSQFKNRLARMFKKHGDGPKNTLPAPFAQIIDELYKGE